MIKTHCKELIKTVKRSVLAPVVLENYFHMHF